MSQEYMLRGHCEERRRFLRFARNRLRNLILFICHCEEQSDVAISTFFNGIAALPSVARNDNSKRKKQYKKVKK
jgi:hypothetical protein